MTFKQLKKENKELKEKIEKLQVIVKDIDNNHIEAFNKMCSTFESQLKIQDKELARRLTIIHYLETKALKVFE